MISFGYQHETFGDRPFSPEGGRLLLGRRRTTLAVRHATRGQRLSEDLHAHHYGEHAEFSPDGRRVIVADHERFAFVYDVTPFPVPTTNRYGSGSPVIAHQISTDRRHVLAATLAGAARLWQTHSVVPVGPELTQDTPIVVVALSPKGLRAATGGQDGQVVLWDPVAGRRLLEPLAAKGESGMLAFSPDGTKLAVATKSSQCWLWDATTGAALHSGLLLGSKPGANERIYALAFAPDGARLMVAGDRGLGMFDVASGRRLWRQTAGVPIDATFDRDGRWVAAVDSRDRQAHVFDAATGRTVLGPLPHPSFTLSVAFHPAGKSLLTGSEDGMVRFWDLDTGLLSRSLPAHTNGIRGLRFSADGRRLATASWDNNFRIWDAESDLPLTEPMTGHGASDLRATRRPAGKTPAPPFSPPPRRLAGFPTRPELW